MFILAFFQLWEVRLNFLPIQSILHSCYQYSLIYISIVCFVLVKPFSMSNCVECALYLSFLFSNNS